MLLEIGAARPSIGLLLAGWVLVAVSWFGASRGRRGPYQRETSDRRDRLRNLRQKSCMAAIALTSAMAALQIDRIWGEHGAAKAGIAVFAGLFVLSLIGVATINLLDRPQWSIPPDLRPRHHRRERP